MPGPFDGWDKKQGASGGWLSDISGWFGGGEAAPLEPAVTAPVTPFAGWNGQEADAGAARPGVFDGLMGDASKWTPLEGAGWSTLSAIPELFGAQAAKPVEDWRAEHPILDLTTSLLGAAIPYGGAYVASTRIPRAAKALEAVTGGTIKAFGSTAARSPIAAGALKEFLRYTPLELTRLGTGMALGADMGDMFSDVLVSSAFNSAAGGLGGFLRAGGKAVERATQTIGVDSGLLPGVELRLTQAPDAVVTGDKAQRLWDLEQEALRYVPEKWQNPAKAGEPPKTLPGRYVHSTVLDPNDAQWYEGNLYKPNAPNASAETVAAQPFDVRQLHTDNKAWSVNAGVGEDVAQRAGFESLSDLAAHLNVPRRVVVQGEIGGRTSAAAQLGGTIKRSIDSGAMIKVAPETWAMPEDGGTFQILKRLSRGKEPEVLPGAKKPAYQFGPAQVRQGDEFLLGSTDRIDRLVPDVHKVTQGTVERWARMREPFRPMASAAPQQAALSLSMKLLPFEDWNAIQGLNRQKGLTYLGSRVAEKLKAEMGLADQATVRAISERLYDVFRPKLGKMMGDAQYGRYLGLLEDVQRRADDVAKRYTFGDPDIQGTMMQATAGKNVKFKPYKGFDPLVDSVAKLDEAERQQFVMASIAQFPADELKAMKAAGTVSPKVTDALEHFRVVNEHFVANEVLPALDEAGMANEIRWLEGYTIPRLFKGDNFVRVVDEAGKPKWLANGRNGKEAQELAASVIEEARLDGKTWKAQPVEQLSFSGIDNTESMDDLYRSVHEQMGQSPDAQAIVGRAIKKMMSNEFSRSSPGLPGKLRNARTGLPGTPDIEHYSADDIVKAVNGHMQQLGRYAGVHAWKYRLGGQMSKWGALPENAVAYEDLNRKALQSLGVEGHITKKLNQLLTPVLGGVLGGKPATRIANATNKLMANWNLFILNPSFAVLNMLSPLQQVAPWLSFMMHAPDAAQMRMSQMTPRFNSAGQAVGSAATLSVPKVLAQAMRLVSKPTDELRQFYNQALSDGTIGSHIHDEFIGSGAAMVGGIREAWAKGPVEGLTKIATGMATKSEQWSRLVAFNSAYILGKDFFKYQGDDLYRFMRKGTETTMYGYHVMDRSRVLTGPLGGSWGLFKNWQFHFIDSMREYAGLAMKDGVWGPMLWQGGSALALGGIGATPLVMLADGLAKWDKENNNSYLWMRDNWGPEVGDGLYFGLPSLLGISLQSSSSIPGTDVTQDIEALSNVVAWERGKAAFTAIGAAADTWQATGNNPFKERRSKPPKNTLGAEFPIKLAGSLDDETSALISADERLTKALNRDYSLTFWMTNDSLWRLTGFAEAMGISADLNIMEQLEQLAQLGTPFMVQGALNPPAAGVEGDGFFSIDNPAPLPE